MPFYLQLNFCLLLLVPIGSTIGMLYYGAVVFGLYKDPLMREFRRYGEEKRPYPINRLLLSAAAWCITLAIIVDGITASSSVIGSTFVPLIFVVLGIMALVADQVARRHPRLREALPAWYYDLLRVSSRQERRFIGYAWLRIPRRMRWRLNGDNQAFRSWVDTVRITVIYGAYDPDNPWTNWV